MSDSGPTVSVVVATFNGAPFLAAQLESILEQSRLPDQVVITDDGSTDNTLEVVALASRSAPQSIVWTVVENSGESRGPAKNFESGVALATGDFIALADQDDWWFPKKLAVLESILTASPELLLVHSDADLVDQGGHLLGMTVLDSLRVTSGERRNLVRGGGLAALVRRNLVTGHTVMLRRQLLEMAGPIPPGWLHDEWWALVAAAHGQLRLYPKTLGHYRQHPVNQVGASRSGVKRLSERFREPQGEFRRRHDTRHDGLAEFLRRSGEHLPPESVALLSGRIDHYAWQAGLSPSRWARVFPIIGVMARGGYRRYRRGLFDAVRDLVQPSGG